MPNNYDPKCAAMHLGRWAIYPHWLNQAVAAIKAGLWPVKDAKLIAEFDAEGTPRILMDKTDDGIAIVPMTGAMMKGDSKFGGVSTLRARRALRMAVADPEIDGIMLHIDSPGGTVAGTKELADDVRAAGASKLLYVHADDLIASAAYWVGSQATRLTANATAEVGSIGTLAIVEDTSGAAEMDGVKVHVISTGEFKGAFADGAPVTEAHLADLQQAVDDLNAHFLAGIAAGRGDRIKAAGGGAGSLGAVKRLANELQGRVVIADKAMGMGLIDGVTSFDGAMDDLRKAIRASKREKARNDRLRSARLGA